MRKLLPLLVSVLTVGSMGLARADAQSVMLSLLFGEEGLPSGKRRQSMVASLNSGRRMTALMPLLL